MIVKQVAGELGRIWPRLDMIARMVEQRAPTEENLKLRTLIFNAARKVEAAEELAEQLPDVMVNK